MDLISYNNGKDIITDNDILQVVEDECYKLKLENGLEDIENISSAKFNILLTACGKYFNSLKALWNDPANINKGINKEYIYILCDYYIYLTNIYNKRCSLAGFKYFIGLHTTCLVSTITADNSIYNNTISDIDNHSIYKECSNNNIYISNDNINNINNNNENIDSKYTTLGFKPITISDLRVMCQYFNSIIPYVTKMLTDADNELQLSNARDSKQAVLNLGYNNYMHNWNGTIRAQETQATIKTLEEIRNDRAISDKNNQNTLKYNDFLAK